MTPLKALSITALLFTAGVAAYYAQQYSDKLHKQSATLNLCAASTELPATNAGIVWIEPGSFVMGIDKGHKDKDSGYYQPFPEESGECELSLNGFWMDTHEVSNAQFLKFIEATNYKTVAEARPKKEWFPANFPDEQRVAGSAVFVIPKSINNKADISQWWQYKMNRFAMLCLMLKPCTKSA